MIKSILPIKQPVSLEDALQLARESGHSHAAVQANYQAEVEAVESEVGPQVAPLLSPQGRPRKGQRIEAALVHTLRVKPSIWHLFTAKAQATGLSANAAAQLALFEWAQR